MAGGKETPRQKMIGMMYLVLTALLALNVSKSIIAAFVTLNDKLDSSAEIIHNTSEATYTGFDQKRAALKATGGDLVLFEQWAGRSETLKKRTKKTVGFLLSECNDMIKESESVDWYEPEDKDEDGDIIKLKPLMDIQGMDNYDIPTQLFVGGNPSEPNERGMALMDSVHSYRDFVCGLMGTYKMGKKTYVFEPPASPDLLHESLLKCNEKDTQKIAAFYHALTIPETLPSHTHDAEPQPWPSVVFDHAPIVAAAAMFTSLKLDIKNGESIAADYMLSKIDAPTFNFNKIEPLAFARTGYINQGDSLGLSVMIAAYDSNEVSKIRYAVDEDTAADFNDWKMVNGDIGLKGDKPGAHKVKGGIAVKEKGEETWKTWDFSYTVGQPMGVVALPEMRILYRGYDNIVEGTASGFDPDKVTLSGSGCTLSSKGKGQYIARVRGGKSAKISVSGKKDDGGSVNLGSFDFKVKALPTPALYLGGIKNGASPGLSSVKAQSKVSCRYDETVPLTGVSFTIQSGTVTVEGLKKRGKVNSGGSLDANAKSILKQSRGKQVTIMVNYRGPDGISKKTACVFQTR